MTSSSQHNFSVDIRGLLRALTEQFPEPLLCVRELIQNAADAGSNKIEVDIAFDAECGLIRLSVSDDGRGMNAADIQGYLTIGHSQKDATRDRGRFGVGKLSPYALGIRKMTVVTSDGEQTHRISFDADGKGTVGSRPTQARGTCVRVYKDASRKDAEQLAERVYALVAEHCGSLQIPLTVNGTPVNRKVTLPTRYRTEVRRSGAEGVIGISADPVQVLMGGGIVLESGSAILGPDVSYVLDSASLSPTLSRNSVRRDQAFERLMLSASDALEQLVSAVISVFSVRLVELRREGQPVERLLEADDRAALDWLRVKLFRGEAYAQLEEAPVIETADGNLVSIRDVKRALASEAAVPVSRVPRSRDELVAYVDRGVPVVLLYRDLEDYFEEKEIKSIELDRAESGVEVEEAHWTEGEKRLVGVRRSRRAYGHRFAVGACLLVLSVLLLLVTWHAPAGVSGRSPTITLSDQLTEATQFPRRGANGARSFGDVLAGLMAVLSGSLALGLVYRTWIRERNRTLLLLRSTEQRPLAKGSRRKRRFQVLLRALRHPIDFFAARAWTEKADWPKKGTPADVQANFQRGVRLDLAQLALGFIDLRTPGGKRSDGRVLTLSEQKVLLNRNHPSISSLSQIARQNPHRARLLLDVLLATDPELSKGTDPRQAEWDLLARGSVRAQEEGG